MVITNPATKRASLSHRGDAGTKYVLSHILSPLLRQQQPFAVFFLSISGFGPAVLI